jgi:DNA-binding MarR family transcriptional regulator
MTQRTILLDVFAANQKRERLIKTALAGTDLPPEDYPLYVYIGIEGPLTPTELARELGMPLSTALFRTRRLERRGHAERIPHPEDRRSFLLRLTPAGEQLLARARPAFRERALSVEARLGKRRVGALRDALTELGEAIDSELEASSPESPTRPARRGRSRSPNA